jgi:hypothetical protein
VRPGIREDLAEPVELAAAEMELKDQMHQKAEQALTDLAVAEVDPDMDLAVVKKAVTEDLVL